MIGKTTDKTNISHNLLLTMETFQVFVRLLRIITYNHTQISWQTTAVSTAAAVIHKTILGFGTTALIISNKEIEYIMKTIKSLEENYLRYRLGNI